MRPIFYVRRSQKEARLDSPEGWPPPPSAVLARRIGRASEGGAGRMALTDNTIKMTFEMFVLFNYGGDHKKFTDEFL